MPRIPGTTNAQTLFLRAFRHHPAGPPPEDWPTPVILQRWLARPAFLDALATLREALRVRTEFHLAAAANQAARELGSPPDTDEGLTAQDYKRRLDLLRLAHLRKPLPTELPDAFSPDGDDGDDIARDGINTRPEPMTLPPAFATISPPARADGPRGNTF